MTPHQRKLADRLSAMAAKAGARAVFADKADPVTISITEAELTDMLHAACFSTWEAANNTFLDSLRKRIASGQLKQMF